MLKVQKRADRMRREQHRYFSYLLRIWEARTDGDLVWRASLERPGTGERRGFTSLEDLFDFVRERTGKELSASEQETSGIDQLKSG